MSNKNLASFSLALGDLISEDVEPNFTICNRAGGDLRTFHLRNGEITGAAIRHAKRIESTLGGPEFHGPAAGVAREQYDRIMEDLND